MPEPLHPPYPPVNVQPRTLNRWLDVNSQNGPLGRIQYFITLPAFSVVNTWLGYSDIVAAFNFEAPNGFILKSGYSVPVNPNYTLCIMWEDSQQVTHRYSLWRAVGDKMFFTIAPYTGQNIKKNFRLEIWSTNNTPLINVAPLQFYTSVFGNVDYRYGVDTDLKVADNIITNFGAPLGVMPLPQVMGPTVHWNPSAGLISGGGGAFTSWTDTINAEVLLPTNAVSVSAAIGTVNASSAVGTANNSTIHKDISAILLTIASYAIAVRLNVGATTGTLFSDGAGNNILKYDTGLGGFQLYNGATPEGSVTGIVTGVWYVIVVTGGTIAVYNMQTGLLVGAGAGAAAIGTASVITIGNVSMQVLDVILGSNLLLQINDIQNLVDYYTAIYFRLFNLPLVFPAGANPQLN